MKVSFDFDSTLDNQHVQNFAKKLMDDGFDVHIVTGRPTHWSSYEKWDNDDLYAVAKKLNIKKENIHFNDFKLKKYFFLKNEDFIFHLDDDHIETEEINFFTKVPAILFDEKWMDNIMKLINI